METYANIEIVAASGRGTSSNLPVDIGLCLGMLLFFDSVFFENLFIDDLFVVHVTMIISVAIK